MRVGAGRPLFVSVPVRRTGDAEGTIMTDATSIVRDLVDRQARAHDADVLAVEVKGQGSRRLVRVVVDRKGGIPVDVCQRICKELSRQLDAIDPVGARYTCLLYTSDA